MHTDLSNVPLEDVKNVGQDITIKLLRLLRILIIV